MNFYVAARTQRIPDVQKIIETLEKEGHKVTLDWTKTDYIERPYINHIHEVTDLAKREIDAIKKAEIFIILGDDAGTGMYLEMGVALANDCKVYAIEPNEVTIFHFHHNVTRIKNIRELFDYLHQ